MWAYHNFPLLFYFFLLHFFLLVKFILNWRITALQCVLCFLPYINIDQPGYTCVPSLLNHPVTSHPFPPTRLSRSTGFALPASCSKSHWLSILLMLMCMLQYYSFISHHLLPPLCPKVCSLCLHLHCCPENRFISTICLDSFPSFIWKQ